MSEREQDKPLEETAGEERPAGEKNGRELYEWVQALVCSVLAVVVLFTFVVRLVRVDGQSMRETLQHGDLMAVVNRPLCGSFDQGNVVVLRKSGFHGGGPIVKRIIAMAGQTVDIDFETGSVFVDGSLLNEPYVRELTFTDEGMDFPLTVPDGCVFVMGDNRNESDDSRNPLLGPVDVRCIIGKAVLVLLPGEDPELERRAWDRVGMVK